MGVRDDGPLLLGHGGGDLDLVALGARPALDHVAGVDLVFQDTAHGGVGPEPVADLAGGVPVAQAQLPLVQGGVGDAHLVEPFRNADDAHALQEPLEDAADHFGGSRVHHQMVAVVRVLAVAVGGEGADELPLAPFPVQGGADLVGDIPAVLIVHHVFKGYEGVVDGGGVLHAVDVVHHGDKTDVEQGEDHLQILADQDVVPAQPGQVLDDDAVDCAAFDVVHHPLEIRAVEVRPGPAVVDIRARQADIAAAVHVFAGDILLCGDAVAFLFIAVLSGDTQISRRPPLGGSRRDPLLFFDILVITVPSGHRIPPCK